MYSYCWQIQIDRQRQEFLKRLLKQFKDGMPDQIIFFFFKTIFSIISNKLPQIVKKKILSMSSDSLKLVGFLTITPIFNFLQGFSD